MILISALKFDHTTMIIRHKAAGVVLVCCAALSMLILLWQYQSVSSVLISLDP